MLDDVFSSVIIQYFLLGLFSRSLGMFFDVVDGMFAEVLGDYVLYRLGLNEWLLGFLFSLGCLNKGLCFFAVFLSLLLQHLLALFSHGLGLVVNESLLFQLVHHRVVFFPSVQGFCKLIGVHLHAAEWMAQSVLIWVCDGVDILALFFQM